MECIFCKIIKGEVPGKRVYDDSSMIAILDINPCTKGHVLAMPKEHHPIMPLLPYPVFKSFFGMMPELTKAILDAMLCTGINIFIANGAVAGQQSPHFLLHMIPRESGDGLDKYMFLKGEAPIQMPALQKRISQLMADYLNKEQPKWKPVDDAGLYKDILLACKLADKQACKGHIIVTLNDDRPIQSLSSEESAHLFFMASSCAIACFEVLGAHGSNIIVKSGRSMDNEEGKLSIHILPRSENDSLDLSQKQMQKKPNLDDIAQRISDKTFFIGKKRHSRETLIDLDRPIERIDEISLAIDSLRK